MGNPNHLPGGSSKGGEFTSESFSNARQQVFDAQTALFKASNFDEIADAKSKLSEAEKTMDGTPEGIRSLKTLISVSDNAFEKSALKNRLEVAEKNFAVRSGNTEKFSPEDLPLIPETNHTYDVPTHSTVDSGDGYPVTTGSKYTKYMPLKDVAKSVRLDLKEAQKKGYIPSHLKYSVTSKDKIRVEIQDVPDSKIYKDKTALRKSEMYNEEALELQRRVEGIAGAYNRSRTQSQADYFDEMYYTTVSIQDDSARKWKTGEADRLKKNRDRRAKLNEVRNAFQQDGVQGIAKGNYTVTEQGPTVDGKAKVSTVDEGNMVLVDYGNKVDAYQFDSGSAKENAYTFLNYDTSWFKYSDTYRIKSA